MYQMGCSIIQYNFWTSRVIIYTVQYSNKLRAVVACLCRFVVNIVCVDILSPCSGAFPLLVV